MVGDRYPMLMLLRLWRKSARRCLELHEGALPRDYEALLALPFLGNALRVCNDLTPARAAFDQARKLRAAFSPSDPPLLDESWLPYLEASLCREERRFPEALALLDQPFARDGDQQVAIDLLIKHRKKVPVDQIDFYEWMIVNKSWWDSVDVIADHLAGSFFTGSRNISNIMQFTTSIRACQEYLYSFSAQ